MTHDHPTKIARIQGIIPCRRCKGSLVDVKTGEDCMRCLHPEFGFPTGVDPASYRGCVCDKEHDREELTGGK